MSGIFREFAGQVIRALPDDIGEERMHRWVKSPGALRRALRATLFNAGSDPLLIHAYTLTSPNVRPMIDWMSKDFLRLFAEVNEGGRAEKLAFHKLRRQETLCDADIIAALGGKKAVEVNLASIYVGLGLKERIEDHTPLLAYARDKLNLLRPVTARMGERGWRVDTDSNNRPDATRANRQVLSCVPSLLG